MNNQTLYNNCSRFCQISELDPSQWTQPIRSEYQELLNKLQSGHSIVINNRDRTESDFDEEKMNIYLSEALGPTINLIESRIADVEEFLGPRLGYKQQDGAQTF